MVKMLPPARLALSASCPCARVVSVEMAVLAAAMAASSEVIEAPSASSAEVARVISPLRLVLVVGSRQSMLLRPLLHGWSLP